MKKRLINVVLKFKILYLVTIVSMVVGIVSVDYVVAQTVPKTVKFGCIYPITGPMAANAESLKAAVETAVDYINENGGIKSLGGAKFEVVFADNQMKPAVAATEAERLIQQEKVVALFGFAPSATTLAGSAVAERLQTPFLDSISFADQLCRRGFKYFYEVQPTAYHMVEVELDFLNFFNKKYALNIKRVGIIHEDTDYGKSLSRAQRELLRKSGYELVADIEHNAKSPDLSSSVLKLKAANPEFIIVAGYHADTLQIAKTSTRLDLRVPNIDSETRGEFAWVKAAGPAGEGAFTLVQWDRSYPHPLSRTLTERFEQKYKLKAGHYVGPAFQTVFILKRAIEMAGSSERNRINDALRKLEILPGPDLLIPYEKIKFDETGMNKFGLPFVAQIQDGEVVPIWPEKYVAKNTKIRILENWKKH